MVRLSRELSVVKLDIDRKRFPSVKRLYQLLDRAGYMLLSLDSRKSPSGNGWHLWLTLDPAPRTPMEVIAIQAVLGSDPFRESMNLLRARKMWRTPGFAKDWFNVLYAPCKQRSRRLQLPRS